MNFLKVKNNLFMKIFTVTILSFFIVGMLSVPLHAYQNSGIDQAASAIENEFLAETLAETILLTICIAQLNINQEKKVKALAEILGYDCDEIFALATLFDELDDFIPVLGVITEILWWIWNICTSFS